MRSAWSGKTRHLTPRVTGNRNLHSEESAARLFAVRVNAIVTRFVWHCIELTLQYPCENQREHVQALESVFE
jgi:hypothetical protein